MSLSLHHYQSQFTGAGENQTIQGVLLNNGQSISCLQPWPSLGDPRLEELLEKLSTPESEQHPLLRHSLAAFKDKSFSIETLRAYEDQETSIPTHVLIKKDDTFEEVSSLLKSGVNRFKIKLRKDYDFTAGVFAHLLSLQENFEFWLRFDANATTSKEEFLDCWYRLGALQSRVEFVEDPCPFEWGTWKELEDIGVPIANDRPLHFQKPEEITADFPCSFLVMKPVRHDLNQWKGCFQNSGKKVVLTTALDHPWGQLWAFHSYLKLSADLEKHGILLEHGGFATETLSNMFYNPLTRHGDRVFLKDINTLVRETKEYPWQDL